MGAGGVYIYKPEFLLKATIPLEEFLFDNGHKKSALWVAKFHDSIVEKNLNRHYYRNINKLVMGYFFSLEYCKHSLELLADEINKIPEPQAKLFKDKLFDLAQRMDARINSFDLGDFAITPPATDFILSPSTSESKMLKGELFKRLVINSNSEKLGL